MKTLSITFGILVFFTAFHFAYSQSMLNPEWVLVKPSPLSNGDAEAWAIGTDSMENIFWGVNQDMPGLFQLMDVFLYKMDKDTHLIWVDTIITDLYDQRTYNLKVTDSLIYLAGPSCRTLGIANCDALFLEVSANSPTPSGSPLVNMVWDGGFGYEEIDGIAVEKEAVYLTGWTTGDGTNLDVLLMKVDQTGDLIWQTSFGTGTAREDHQDGHIVVDDSLIFIAGLYDGSPGLGWDGQALLAKFDKNSGALVDSLLFGRQDTWFNAENALGMTSDGTDLFLSGYSTTSPNNWDVFIAKFDKNFNQLWYQTWGGASTESARAIAVASDGSIFIGGNTKSFGGGDIDIVLLKYDAEGNLLWYRTWGSTGDDQTLDIHLHNKTLYLTGKTNSFHPNNKWEALLLKVDLDAITSVFSEEETRQAVILYPNPMKDFALLKFEPPIIAPYVLTILDVKGKKIATLKGTSDEIWINRNNMPSGLYFFELEVKNERLASGKFIVK